MDIKCNGIMIGFSKIDLERIRKAEEKELEKEQDKLLKIWR